jgi:hypothetical protein
VRIITACILTLSFLLFGCTQTTKPATPAPATPTQPAQPTSGPVINYFFAGPACVVKDHSTTLAWKVTGADSVNIDQGIGLMGPSGNITVSCGQPVTYTLTAKAGSMTTTDSTTITVAAPPASGTLPVVNYFDTTPNKIPPGEIITILWGVTGADSVSIDNGIGKVDPQGRYGVKLQRTTTYNLTATNSAGSSIAQLTAQVQEPGLVSSYLPFYTTPHVPQQALVGKQFTIVMDAQPSLSFNWNIDYYDPTMVSYVSSNYTVYNPPVRGSDGQQQFTFQAIAAGDTRILVSNVNRNLPADSHPVFYDIHIQPY